MRLPPPPHPAPPHPTHPQGRALWLEPPRRSAAARGIYGNIATLTIFLFQRTRDTHMNAL